MSRTHANRGVGGPVRHPEVDVAHMRYCREVKRMTFATIAAQEFGNCYTSRYINQVCNYEVRPFIKPRNRDADTN